MPFTNQNSNNRRSKYILGVLMLVFVLSSATFFIFTKIGNAQGEQPEGITGSGQAPLPGFTISTTYNAFPKDLPIAYSYTDSYGEHKVYKNPDGITYSDWVQLQGTETKDESGNWVYSMAYRTLSSSESQKVQNEQGQKAASIGDALGWIPIPVIGHVILVILYLIKYLFAGLLILSAKIADITINMGSFTKMPLVRHGWEISRDLANMFFALILLIIAFATILHLESYGMKKILWRLVVAALLINFSLVIAGVVIDGSQVLSNFFLKQSAMQEGVTSRLVTGLNIQNIYNTNDSTLTAFWNTIKAGSWLGSVVNFGLQMFLAIIVLIVANFVFLALAFLFLIRIVALWILLILAPLAWLSMVLPATQTWWNKWWNEFIKWIIFAPVALFFVYLALYTVQNNSLKAALPANLSQIQTSQAGSMLSGATMFSNTELFMQYIILVVFLIAGLLVARTMGIHGASAAINLGTRMRKATTKGIGGYADRWLAKGAKMEGETRWHKFRRTTSYISPTVWRDAWKERRAVKEEETKGFTVAKRHDQLNWLLSFGKEKTDYAARRSRAERIAEQRKIEGVNAEELSLGFVAAYQANNLSKMMGYTYKLAEGGNYNELEKYLAKIGEKLGINPQGWGMTPAGLVKFAEDVLKPKMGEQRALQEVHDLNATLEALGTFLGRAIYKDQKDGKWKVMRRADGSVDEEEARRIAHIEHQKAVPDPQQWAIRQNRWTVGDETYKVDAQGNIVVEYKINKTGELKLALVDDRQYGRFNLYTGSYALLYDPQTFKKANAGLYEATKKRLKERLDRFANESDKIEHLIAYGSSVRGKPFTTEEARALYERINKPA